MIRSLSESSAPISSEPLHITRVVREHEDDFEQGAKRSCHALDLEPQALLPEHLGLARIDESLFEVSISSTGEHKRSRGHPWGSRNKPKEEPPTCPSSLASFSNYAPSLPYARKGKGLVDQGMIVCSTFTSFMSMAARFYFFYMVIPSGVLR